MHGSTATYTAYRRDTPKLLWIHHPYLKHSTQTLTFSCEKEGKWDSFQITQPACVSLKKPAVSGAWDGEPQLLWHKGGTAGGSKAGRSRRRLLCLCCLRFQSVLKHQTLTAKMQEAYSQQSSARSP